MPAFGLGFVYILIFFLRFTVILRYKYLQKSMEKQAIFRNRLCIEFMHKAKIKKLN